MTELERLLSQDNCCLVSVASIKKALEQESCEAAISRAEALKALDYDIKSFEFKSGVGRHMDEIANLLNTIYEIQSDNIKALPPVRPKTKTGHWIGVDGKPSHLQDGLTTGSVWCSECGKWLTASDEYSCDGKFCPNCGCCMVESQERSGE